MRPTPAIKFRMILHKVEPAPNGRHRPELVMFFRNIPYEETLNCSSLLEAAAQILELGSL